MTQHAWSLSVSRDGWSVRLRAEPWWAQVLESTWDKACGLTRGWLGGHNLPAVFWRIPTSRPRWDHDDPDGPWLENSVASRLHNLEGFMLGWSDRHGREIATIPITEDLARAINPAFVQDWLDSE
ncbi:MAG: hypothetical protein J2P17_34260 [Mycobacterium sp.]|nr:hypothetical protein [Mycobacterium sp.]